MGGFREAGSDRRSKRRRTEHVSWAWTAADSEDESEESDEWVPEDDQESSAPLSVAKGTPSAAVPASRMSLSAPAAHTTVQPTALPQPSPSSQPSQPPQSSLPASTAEISVITRPNPRGPRVLRAPGPSVASPEHVARARNLVSTTVSSATKRVKDELETITKLRQRHHMMCGCPQAATNGTAAAPANDTKKTHTHACNATMLSYHLRHAFLEQCSKTCFHEPERITWHKPNHLHDVEASPMLPSHTATCLCARRELKALETADTSAIGTRRRVERLATLLDMKDKCKEFYPLLAPETNDDRGWANLDQIQGASGILRRILQHVDSLTTLAAASQTCRGWRQAASCPTIWRRWLARLGGTTVYSTSALDTLANPRDACRQLWSLRRRRLHRAALGRATSAHPLAIPDSERIVAASVSARGSPSMVVVGTTEAPAPTAAATRMAIWVVDGPDNTDGSVVGRHATTTTLADEDAHHGNVDPVQAGTAEVAVPPTYVITLAPDNPALAMLAVGGGGDGMISGVTDGVCVLALHPDGLRRWSREGTVLQHVPYETVDSTDIHVPDSVSTLLCADGPWVCHASAEATIVRVVNLSATPLHNDDNRPVDRTATTAAAVTACVSVIVDGPVQCLTMACGKVVVATGLNPIRGMLLVLDASTTTTQQRTWLPPNRHVTNMSCVHDVVVTSDTASVVCVWSLRDIQAPLLVLAPSLTLGRHQLRPPSVVGLPRARDSASDSSVVAGAVPMGLEDPPMPPVPFSTVAMSRMMPCNFVVFKMYALPTGLVEVSGGYSGDPRRWKATFALSMHPDSVSLDRVVVTEAAGVVVDASLAWSVCATDDGVMFYQ
eukprot:m.208644 g.208644  ORF g.208644 m.208644 type:complete len:839 (-) comp24197_c0_seq1:147-2663(-)